MAIPLAFLVSAWRERRGGTRVKPHGCFRSVGRSHPGRVVRAVQASLYAPHFIQSFHQGRAGPVVPPGRSTVPPRPSPGARGVRGRRSRGRSRRREAASDCYRGASRGHSGEAIPERGCTRLHGRESDLMRTALGAIGFVCGGTAGYFVFAYSWMAYWRWRDPAYDPGWDLAAGMFIPYAARAGAVCGAFLGWRLGKERHRP